MSFLQDRMSSDPPPVATERRRNHRFQLELPLRYSAERPDRTQVRGEGLTVNISSGGALVKINDPMPLGTHLDLSIDWPIQAGAPRRLRLKALGEVIRSDDDSLAIVFRRHEFHPVAT